ncbi:DUF6141 family protein [Paenibacillaceae bacterium WGS1546]|uniref:DUF6141 family protein n=1 Tax=Cohnella sp. WGS1546 TaxID=3366810 RepID=UPI00372D0C58
MTGNKTIVYKEKQSLPKWTLVIILIFALFIWGIALTQFITGIPVGNQPVSDTGMIVFTLIFGVFFPLLLLSMKGQVMIDTCSVVIRLTPIYKKVIDFQQIQSVTLTKVKPIEQFGGWGIRWNGKKWGLILEGDEGVEIVLKSGQVIVIASKTPEKLLKAIEANLHL